MPQVQQTLFDEGDLFNIKEASKWASKYLDKDVSESNISYLIQYGKVRKIKKHGKTLVSKKELIKYYESYSGTRELRWKEKLGEDLNWALSFDHLREKDTTKHVHRLHPYKGKFIPQLVEYFLDDHIDDFKTDVFFNKGDIVLDPFCGSGTTIVQANELRMHAIGIDVSFFNILISSVKVAKYDLIKAIKTIEHITRILDKHDEDKRISEFDEELLKEMYIFNSEYFPSPDFRYKVSQNQIDEDEYGKTKANEFLPIYEKLIEKYRIKLRQPKEETFLDKWFIQNVRDEIDLAVELVNSIDDHNIKNLLTVILSRAVRSCRATTHSDLATLKKPQLTSYYCVKHKKICKPLFSIRKKWAQYSKDTIRRLELFNSLRNNTYHACLTGDSRAINIFKELEKKDLKFSKLARKNKIKGIFTSPPYVGLINYHEQHAYAYELFGFEMRQELEIGPLFKGKGRLARESYIEGISAVLNNCKKYLDKDFNIFIVANDRHNLYSTIAKETSMEIVNLYKRPVLNRTERDKAAYSEVIFHFKGDAG